MHEVEIVIGLLAAVAALAWAASRLNVAYPIFLVVGGLALGFVPGLPRVSLRPDLVFLLFLPPILYYAALVTSWREFKSNIRPISLLAIGLVLFTTLLVAAAARWLTGMSWAASFALGAIVSPPDAVAATAVAQRLGLPKRIVVILEGESLVNDATALVAYGIAVAVATGEVAGFSLGAAALSFLKVGAGGVAVGLAVAWVVAWVRPRIKDQSVEGAVSLLTPFIVYLPAEWLHVSGVLAVVAAGVYLSRRLPLITTPRVRLRAYAVWDAVVFILNGLAFILIGLQLPAVVGSLSQTDLWHLIGYAAAVSLVAVAARLLWVFPATYVPRRLFPRLAAGDPAPPWQGVFIIAWAGMRGIVSLAAALALPTGFPHRHLILFITFGVILATLVVQGLSLPPLIRRLGLSGEDEQERGEEVTARYLAALAAVERLDRLTAECDGVAATAMVMRLRQAYDERIEQFSGELVPADGENGAGRRRRRSDDPQVCHTGEEVAQEAIAAERQMLVRLRDDGVIGDEVLRRIQEELDLEESRLGG